MSRRNGAAAPVSPRITGEHCLDVLARREHSGNRISAHAIAKVLGTGSRAVATALRKPVADGRASCYYPRSGSCLYGFISYTGSK